MVKGEQAEIHTLDMVKSQFGLDDAELTPHQHHVDVLIDSIRLAIEVKDMSGKKTKAIRTFRKQREQKNQWAKDNRYTLITIAWDNGNSRWKLRFKSFKFEQMWPMGDLDYLIRYLRRTPYENRRI